MQEGERREGGLIEPVSVIVRRPGFVTAAVEAIHGNDAGREKVSRRRLVEGDSNVVTIQ